MELFTFLRMGGKRERIHVAELSAEAQAALQRFDASRAMCFVREDREKLLAVIEAGFGDIHPFNEFVRGILTERAALGRQNRLFGRRPSLSRRVAPQPPAEAKHECESSTAVEAFKASDSCDSGPKASE